MYLFQRERSLRPYLVQKDISITPILPFSLGILVLTVILEVYRLLGGPSDGLCVKELFAESPANREIKYRWQDLHEYYSPPEKYRGSATAEREANWDELTPYSIISTDSGHTAVIGTVLQMNCLRTIRQYIYIDTASPTLNSSPTREMVNQCIEILREYLMCNFDTTPYLMVNSAKAASGTLPVMENMHYCRDYSSIIDWAEKHAVKGDYNFPEAFITDL